MNDFIVSAFYNGFYLFGSAAILGYMIKMILNLFYDALRA